MESPGDRQRQRTTRNGDTRRATSGKPYLFASVSRHTQNAHTPSLTHPHYPQSRISSNASDQRRPKHRDAQHRRPPIPRAVRISLQIDDGDPYKRLDQDVHGFLPPPGVDCPTGSSPLTRLLVQGLVGSSIRPSLPSLPLSVSLLQFLTATRLHTPRRNRTPRAVPPSRHLRTRLLW
jgi:hypothetical protein